MPLDVPDTTDFLIEFHGHKKHVVATMNYNSLVVASCSSP